MGLPVRLFSINDFCKWRKKIKIQNAQVQRQGSNKDLWFLKKHNSTYTHKQKNSLRLHSNYNFLVFSKRMSVSCINESLYYDGLKFIADTNNNLLTTRLATVFGYNTKNYIFTPFPYLTGAQRSLLHISQSSRAISSFSILPLTNFNSQTSIFLKWYSEFSWVLLYFIFIKIKYKGKSYKWHRRKKSLILRFGYSHAVSIPIPRTIYSKKSGKMKLIFFGTNRYELRRFLAKAIEWRPMNIYNGRGLRFARQLVFRKAGKTSAYR